MVRLLENNLLLLGLVSMFCLNGHELCLATFCGITLLSTGDAEWINRFSILVLRTAIICILVWVLGAVTSKCFGVSFPGLGWFSHMPVLMSYSECSRVSLCRSLRLSPAVHSVLLSLWALATLTSLDSQLHFFHLGGPQGPAWVPPLWSTAWRLWRQQAGYMCGLCCLFLVSRDHCLSLLV